jgi:polysaccharide export outer membrane protein
MAVRKAAMQIQAATAALLMIGMTLPSRAAQTDGAPPKELIQYVHDARRRGVADGKIQQQAVAAGWPAGVVNDAIAQETSATNARPGGPKTSAGPAMAPASVDAQPQLAAAAITTPPGHPTPPPAAAADRGVPDDYLIGAGDTLQISVWKEPDASVGSVVVRPDGKISMPLLKEIEVMGMTPTQLERDITTKLSKLINSADVTVVVAAINSKKIYIVGAAKREGPLAYTYRMTVIQALSEAGGLTDYAKRKKIYVLRTENNKEYQLPFNYDEVIKGERMEQNILLLPGDTIIIPH